MNPYLLPFEDFFTYLQQQGFGLGVDDFLQVQTLLNRLPEDCPPEQLKRLLAPLIVVNKDEQELFYQSFDRYFNSWVTEEQATKAPSAAFQKAQKKALSKEDGKKTSHYQKYDEGLNFSFKAFVSQHFQTMGVAFLVLLLLIAGAYGYFNMPEQKALDKVEIVVPQQENASVKEILPTSKKEANDLNKDEQKLPAKTSAENQAVKTLQKESTQIQSSPNDWSIGEDKEEVIPKKMSLKQIAAKSTNADTGIGFWLFVTLVSLLYLSWICRWYFNAKKEFQLQALDNLKPPQYWNIQVPKSELSLTRSKSFKNAATQLQTRQTIPTQRIDVSRTVASTIAAGGFPSFEFLRRSELPEYLLLIDQSSVKDQQAKWFDMWFEGLKAQEVFVHRYFYHHDTQWFWDAEEQRISLKELQHRLGGCRLVVIADLSMYQSPKWEQWIHSSFKNKTASNTSSKTAATSFFNTQIQPAPFKGALMEDFAEWEDKILLSPNRLSRSVVEFLEEMSGFVVLPAKTESLNEIAYLFEPSYGVSSNAHFQAFAAKTDWEKLNVRETFKELKRQLNQTSFRWLCATAMYPEMNWNLTLFIGETLFDERELMKEENVLPLVGLPWLRKGTMPENLRRLLVRQLGRDDKRLVKEAILHLLQLHPLIEEEYNPDFFDYQLYIALERARIHPHDQQKLAAVHELSKEQQFEKSRYRQVVLRYLTEQKDSLSLGESFSKWFEQKDNVKAAGQKKFVYPKADFENRWASMVVKALRMCLVNMVVLIFVLVVFDNIGMSKQMGFLIGLVFSLIGSLRTADGEVGGWHDESSKWLVLIDMRTNQTCSVWKTTLRRCADLLPLVLVAVWAYFYGADMTAFWTVFVSMAILNLVLIDVMKGRRLGDFLLGTQVVNKNDFEKGNWERKGVTNEH